MDLPDDTIVQKALGGDSLAFDELARRVRPLLLRVAGSRLGRPDLAEDAVQETLLAAYRFRRTFNWRYSFRTWLWTILLRECQRVQSRLARQQSIAGLQSSSSGGCSAAPGHHPSTSEVTGLDRILAQERSELLETLLGRLSVQQADALRLRFYAGLKFQEIADTMQCSLPAAKNRVQCGLARLSKWLRARETETCERRTDPRSADKFEDGGAKSEGAHAL